MAFRDSLNRDFRRMLVGEFADDAIVRASLETVVRVRGIYDNTYLEVDPQTGATVASKKPRVTVFVGDVSFEIRQGYYVTVEARSYKVRDIQPDGLGSASLYLDPVRAGEMNTASAFEDDAPEAEDAQSVDVRADATEDLSVEDTASWVGVGERAESDIVALDDVFVGFGEGLIPADEDLDISDLTAVAAGMAAAYDRQYVEPVYSGDFLYSGALDYGATPFPGIDKPMTMTVTLLGVPTEEVLT